MPQMFDDTVSGTIVQVDQQGYFQHKLEGMEELLFAIRDLTYALRISQPLYGSSQADFDRVVRERDAAIQEHAQWLADAKERGARGAGSNAGMKKEQRADGVTT